MKTRLTLILVLLIYIGAASHTHAQQKKVIKTMMIAGQDGSHYWQGACEAMKQILENSGMFKVDFAFTPDFGGDIATFKPDFHQYDLIVINYGGATWTEPVRKNFEKYVADGGGVVVIHSSVVPMADWKEYNEIIGMGAWDGRPVSVLERRTIRLRLLSGVCRLPRLAARNRHRTPRSPSSYPAGIATSMETLQGRDIYPPTRSGKKHGNIGHRLRTRTA